MINHVTKINKIYERKSVSNATSVLSKYPDYEVNIGMEVHVQLTTNTKIFCTCQNTTDLEQNINVCQICTGHPGTLPILNKEVVINAIKAGLATKSQITPLSKFARKHYFYPDLPKGYQITQDKLPICTEGRITIYLPDGAPKDIKLTRIHIEEDAGKNIHSSVSNESFVNLNRAGTPLLEVVSYPDISSAYETKEYLKSLRLIVQYLGICTGNMEEGAFRADTNISVRKKGQNQLGTRCELKNINSFKFISDAIEYEIERQINLLESGQKVIQETRLWDTKNKETVPMRSKEEAADYRYFLDPDLPHIEVSESLKASVKADMPELPAEKLERLQKEHGLSIYEADILVTDINLANYYEQAADHTKSNKLINWFLRNVMGALKDQKVSLEEFKIRPAELAKLVNLIESGTINNRVAQEIFEDMMISGKNPEIIVKEKGLEQIGSEEELDAIVKEIIESNSKQTEAFKAGNQKLMGFFVGQIMKKTQGKANPQIINKLLNKYLS